MSRGRSIHPGGRPGQGTPSPVPHSSACPPSRHASPAGPALSLESTGWPLVDLWPETGEDYGQGSVFSSRAASGLKRLSGQRRPVSWTFGGCPLCEVRPGDPVPAQILPFLSPRDRQAGGHARWLSPVVAVLCHLFARGRPVPRASHAPVPSRSRKRALLLPLRRDSGGGHLPRGPATRQGAEGGPRPPAARSGCQPCSLRPAVGPRPSRVHTGLWPLAGPSCPLSVPGGRHLRPPAWQSPGPVLSRSEGQACAHWGARILTCRGGGGLRGGCAAPPPPLSRSSCLHLLIQWHLRCSSRERGVPSWDQGRRGTTRRALGGPGSPRCDSRVRVRGLGRAREGLRARGRAGAVRVPVTAEPCAAPATPPASQATGTIRADACRAPA